MSDTPFETPSRVIFMGTPDFAVPTLRVLLEEPDFDVVGVVTQPDRPAGRGRSVHESPVKQVAQQAGVPVIQPNKLREPDAFEQLVAWESDYLVVAAFGQILPQKVLDLPRIAPINVHASLLPRWRGAAPIHAAIRAGDTYTGVTTMQMDAGLDTGPVLLQDSIPIAPCETGETLHDKLARLGAGLLIHTLRWLRSGSITPHPQPTKELLVTYAPQLSKEDGAINWAQSAIEIDRHVRAYTPWPGTFTTWNGKRLKILAGYPLAVDVGAPPGMVVGTAGTPMAEAMPFVIAAGKLAYVPTRVQVAGRQVVGALDFLNGAPDLLGSILGGEPED
ncbi:MAG: methionyl-tRNA formyltransferase [Chloroflexi bacterium]|mgnify:FL=1|nr:methionyl-tRNA formyltransferase [Chloroflexota bacterium]